MNNQLEILLRSERNQKKNKLRNDLDNSEKISKSLKDENLRLRGTLGSVRKDKHDLKDENKNLNDRLENSKRWGNQYKEKYEESKKKT